MIACVYLPYFAAALLPAPTPLIVARYLKQRATVSACDRAGEQHSVTIGMPLSRARAACPDARIVSADDPVFAEAQERLLDRLWVYTSQVEIDANLFPHHLIAYLDLGRLRTADLRLLADDLRRTIASAFAFQPAMGIGSGKLVAYLAALAADQGTQGVQLIETGGEAEFCASASIDRLPLTREEGRRLRLLGLHTLGEIAVLPANGLIAPFGRRGRLLHQLARGLDGRPVRPARLPQQETIRLSCDRIDARTQLDALIERIAAQLAAALDRRAAAAHRLTLTLTGRRGETRTDTMRILDPVCGLRPLREQLTRLAESLPPLSEINQVEVCAAHLVSAHPVQLELFGERPAHRGVIDLSEALAARYGTDELFQAAAGHPGSLLIERRYVRRPVIPFKDRS